MSSCALSEKSPDTTMDTEQEATNSRWSTGQIYRLRHMIKNGHSGGQIALALGKSRSAILGKAHRMGLKLGAQSPGATTKVHPKPKIRARRDKSEVRTGLKSKARTFSIGRGAAAGDEKPELNIVARVLDPVSAPDGALFVALEQLRPGQCRWPFEIIHGGKKLTRFCGCPADEGGSWCTEHDRRANLSIRAEAAQ